MSYWTTAISGFDVLIAIASLTFFGYLAWRNLHYGKRSAGTIFMEALRLTVVLLLLITLAQPEWTKTIQRLREPELAILVDNSGSMETLDVVNGEGKAATRAAAVAARLADPFYAPLEARFHVTAESFAGSGEHPEATDIGNALLRTLRDRKNLRSVLLISDGDWNLGEDPLGVALKLRTAGIPLFAVAAGSPSYLPDVAIESVDAPSFSIVNEKVLIPFTIQSRLTRDLSTTVTLASPFGVVAEKTVMVPAGGRCDDAVMWLPDRPGDFELTVRLPVEDDEEIVDNNEMTFAVNIRRELLKVLVIEATPRWEYRYLRNALMRDPGVTVNTLLFHQRGMKMGAGPGYLDKFPNTKEDLGTYDVIFLGDVGINDRHLTREQCELIKGLVANQGSGLVFLPGPKGNQLTFKDSPLNDMLPVVYDTAKPDGIAFSSDSQIQLTTYGSDHLLTMLADAPGANRNLWRQLPGFYWNAAVERAKVGANVLAVHGSVRTPTGRMPLLVTQPFGSGNVLFLGTDSAWRWRRGVEDKYHYRFWGQVVRWMAHKRHLAYDEDIRLFFSPENPVIGKAVNLQATVMDKAGFPLTEGTVVCQITAGEGAQQERFELVPEPGGWGVFKGTFTPEKEGDYTVRVTSRDTGLDFATTITVAGSQLEVLGRPARHDTLKALASVTGGSFATIGQVDQLIETVNQLPERTETVRHLQLWCEWWWGAAIVVMAGAYWVMRKRMGML